MKKSFIFPLLFSSLSLSSILLFPPYPSLICLEESGQISIEYLLLSQKRCCSFTFFPFQENSFSHPSFLASTQCSSCVDILLFVGNGSTSSFHNFSFS
ncbi:MAG: hypothetical protein D6805_10365 [Planctomycetota bacterium]|nr:MAG: hypothetical protein D6805_10365 [Planctomycetota bacterium]